jgi:large subunit ribosomal protein L15
MPLVMLHDISPAKGSSRKARRVGRGNSSGQGTTAGRGTKGQHARAGSKKRHGFEGGQSSLLLRQPKLGGFKNPNRIEYEVLNIGDLEKALPAGSYDPSTLSEHKLLKTKKPVKLLGRGEVKKKFELSVHAASISAKDAIKKAGGDVTLIKHR